MQGVVGEHVRGVPLLVGVQMINRRLGTGQHFLVIEKNRAMAQHCEIGINKIARAVKTIKTAGDGRLLRRGTQVPLAGHHGAIPALPETLGQGRHVGQDSAAVTGNAPILGHVSHARLVLVNPAQQGRTRGAAAAGVVKLGKSQSIGGQLVQRRRFNLTAVTTEIRITRIISQDQNNIRLFPACPYCREAQTEGQEGREDGFHGLHLNQADPGGNSRPLLSSFPRGLILFRRLHLKPPCGPGRLNRSVDSH